MLIQSLDTVQVSGGTTGISGGGVYGNSAVGSGMWVLLGGLFPKLSSALTKRCAPGMCADVPHRYSTAVGGEGDLEAINLKKGDTVRA